VLASEHRAPRGIGQHVLSPVVCIAPRLDPRDLGAGRLPILDTIADLKAQKAPLHLREPDMTD
jgi:hypothetical protein